MNKDDSRISSDTLCVGAYSAQPEYYSVTNGVVQSCPAQRHELDLELAVRDLTDR